MISLFSGGTSIFVKTERPVSYGDAESALKRHGFKAFSINRAPGQNGRTELMLSVQLPAEEITAKGVPEVDAVATLRSLAEVLADLDAID
jgi:hypothetical protein